MCSCTKDAPATQEAFKAWEEAGDEKGDADTRYNDSWIGDVWVSSFVTCLLCTKVGDLTRGLNCSRGGAGRS